MKEANGHKRLDECIATNVRQDEMLENTKNDICSIKQDLCGIKKDIHWLRWLLFAMIGLQVGDMFMPNVTQQLFAIIQGVINDVSNML